MWRGSIHSFSRLTVSPLPAPRTPEIRMITGNVPFSFRRYWTSSRSARSFGTARLKTVFAIRVTEFRGLEHDAWRFYGDVFLCNHRSIT